MLFKFACKRYRRIFTNARETAITRAESDFLSMHKASCAECRSYAIQVDALIAAMSDVAVDPLLVSEDFTENIVRGVRKMRRDSYRTSYRPVLVGAAAAFVAVGAILQMVGLQPPAANTDGSAESNIERPIDATTPGELNLFDTPSKLVRDPRPFDV
jgi:predicted anti-sigma-YlaC factor YlaD